MDMDTGQGSVFRGTAYVEGRACGTLIASDMALSFWGGVNPQTGEIIDRHHTLSGKFLQNCVLAIPGGRGSCSGSGVMLELLLNDKGPKAILFERREDILTLGVMIAEEIFGKAIPVVTLRPEDFHEVLKLDGHRIHIEDDYVSDKEFPKTRTKYPEPPLRNHLTTSLSEVVLSNIDKAFLEGIHGEAAQASMRIVLRMADLLGARELIDITQVHVDGCIYTGPGSLAFAEKLRDWGGKVRVPTSLNSISIDQKRWRAQGVDSVFGEAAKKLADAYVEMGARPTFTCAPYQLESAPKLGDQVAWAESNAVVYANSVLGARTMKYPDFLDISIALTGRAPKGGPHIDVNRLASLCVAVSNPKHIVIDDSYYPLLGYHIGTLASSHIPVITGLESLAPSRDDLKAFGAAFATASSAPMFHIVGVTPEATTINAAIDEGSDIRYVAVELKDLNQCWDKLNSASNHDQRIDLVSLGNPHFSFGEVRRLAELCQGRKKAGNASVIVTCNRTTYGLATQAGLVEKLEQFGVQFMTDTCWCMITDPTIPGTAKTIITNSAKYAHYGPGLTGRDFCFGSLAGCVEAACEGRYVGKKPLWLTYEAP